MAAGGNNKQHNAQHSQVSKTILELTQQPSTSHSMHVSHMQVLSLALYRMLLLVCSAESSDCCRYNQPTPVHVQYPTCNNLNAASELYLSAAMWGRLTLVW